MLHVAPDFAALNPATGLLKGWEGPPTLPAVGATLVVAPICTSRPLARGRPQGSPLHADACGLEDVARGGACQVGEQRLSGHRSGTRGRDIGRIFLDEFDLLRQ